MKGISNKRTRAAILLLSIFLTIGMSACQPTPETAPVVGKGDNHLEEMIASSAVSPSPAASTSAETTDPAAALMAAVGAPEAFADSYTNEKGDVTVTIDAKVEVPPVEALPAVQVEIIKFSQEHADKFGKYFLKDAPLFSEDESLTKEEIKEAIVNEKQAIETMKQGGNEEGVRECQDFIKELEKQYKTAPAERKKMPSTLQLIKDKDVTYKSVSADLGKDGEAVFGINSGETYSYFEFVNDGKGTYDTVELSPEGDGGPRGMATSREDAESIVTQCLSDLGITDMQIESVKYSIYLDENNTFNDKEYKATAKQCYAFSMARTVHGVPILHIEGSTDLSTDDPSVAPPEEPEYNFILDPESLEIYVDDTGIVRFTWSSPSKVEEVLSEHVTLLPFEDVVQRAKDNIFYKNYTAYGSKTEINITTIRLNMMRIMRKDKPGEYLIVPVWDFIGNRKFGKGWLPFGDQSYVTINAIDGSMINRSWGY